MFVEEKANTGRASRWHTLPAPDPEDIAAMAQETCDRVSKALQKRGLAAATQGPEEDGHQDPDLDALAQSQPLLAACYAASLQGFVATGKRAGQRILCMGVPAPQEQPKTYGPAHGFNLFAGRCIGAFDRKKREHVIRYMTRPPVPHGSLTWTQEGNVLMKLKRAWSNGTSHMKFTGPEFVERLVSLVPAPRVNLVRYCGLFAPNARLRTKALRQEEAEDSTKAACQEKKGDYLEWAVLMQRVFEVDVTLCPRCGLEGMQIIASITDPIVIRDMLSSMGQSTGPPGFEPAAPWSGEEFTAA